MVNDILERKNGNYTFLIISLISAFAWNDQLVKYSNLFHLNILHLPLKDGDLFDMLSTKPVTPGDVPHSDAVARLS